MSERVDIKKRMWIVISYIVLLLVILFYHGIKLESSIQTSQNLRTTIILLAATCMLHIFNFEFEKKISRIVLNIITVVLYPLFIVSFIWGFGFDDTVERIELVFINALFIYVLVLFILAVTGRIRLSIYVTTIINWILYLGWDIVFVLRKTPLVPSDLYSIRTAAAVAGNYTFCISSELILATVAVWFIIVFCHKMKIYNKIDWKNFSKGKWLIRIVPALVVGGIIAFFLMLDIHNYENDDFDTERMNKLDGTLFTFYIKTQQMKLSKPAGYSLEKVNEIKNKYQEDSFNTDFKPNVVVIMDEAFSDLSVISDLKTTKDPLEFCHSQKNDAMTRRGLLNVSVWGGNTCNTEFEFLTGNSLYLLPKGCIPYMQYISKNTDSLCRYFDELGYKKIAIHPYWGQCWRRDTNYENFGFDQFIDAEKFDSEKDTKDITDVYMHGGYDFGDLEYVRNYISDRESFRMVRKQLEQKKEGESLFIFNITMQNHGGYLANNGKLELKIKNSLCESKAFEQYVNLVAHTDEAIEEFVDFVRNFEEPTIVLFFGDHQPGLDTSVYDALFEGKQTGLALDSYRKHFVVPYYIWSNYELEDVKYPFTSPNYLSMILKKIGKLPMDSWDKQRQVLQKKYPVVNGIGIKVYNAPFQGRDSIISQMLDEYNIMEYYNIFEKK